MLFDTQNYYDSPLKDGGHIVYYPFFFDNEISNHYFEQLQQHTPWQQDDITVFGKVYKQPRLTALYGNNNNPYSYSNITMHPIPFSEILIEIKQKVEEFSKVEFTTCLLNLYRDGRDSNGWHADNEKELGTNPIIASVSFGAQRVFHLKHRMDKSQKIKLNLEHGSLLLMKGTTQHYWLHQIAKTKKIVDKRINLTFRILK